MDTTSASLLVRLQSANRDSFAWNRFVELYTPLIYFWARKMGLQSNDASDLVQDVLTTLVGKLPDFRHDPNKSFRGWLRTVTMNKLRENLRRKSIKIIPASTSELGKVDGSPGRVSAKKRARPYRLPGQFRQSGN